MKLKLYCLEGCPYSIKVANTIIKNNISKSFYKLSWVNNNNKKQCKEILGKKLNINPNNITFPTSIINYNNQLINLGESSNVIKFIDIIKKLKFKNLSNYKLNKTIKTIIDNI